MLKIREIFKKPMAEQNEKPTADTGVDNIIASLQGDAEEWTQEEYCLIHPISEIEIWTANGQDSLALHRPGRIPFTPEEQCRLFKVIKEWQKFELLRITEKLNA